MKITFKRLVLGYYQGKCFVCGYMKFLDIHHLKQKKDGGEDISENCVALCPNHHKEWHYIENTYYRRCAKAIDERMTDGRDHNALGMDAFKDVQNYHEKNILPLYAVNKKPWWESNNDY